MSLVCRYPFGIRAQKPLRVLCYYRGAHPPLYPISIQFLKDPITNLDRVTGKDDNFQTAREPPLLKDHPHKLPTVDPKTGVAGENARGNAYVQALPVLQDQPHGLPNVGIEDCLAGGNSAQAPPLFQDQPHGLPTVDPEGFRQHARSK